MEQYCGNCGAPVAPGAGFCAACGTGTRMEMSPGTAVYTGAPQGIPAGPLPAPPGIPERWSPTFLDSFKTFLKEPKKLLSLLVLAVIWLILSLLPAMGINPLPVKILSFLTFAQGGMYGGVLGALGGVIGKALFAYGFSVLIAPLFSGRNPFKGMGSGFKGFLAGLALQSANAAGELILGAGAALILFNFFTGNAGAVNSMAGIAGFILALKMLFSRSGPIWRLLLEAAHRLTRGRTPSGVTASRLVSGFAAGSALGAALSLLQLPYLPYLAGAVLLFAGLVLALAVKPGREVPAV